MMTRPLLHPLSVTAVVLLIANDQFLKPLAPGLVAGKLSDIAGLVFFPLLLVTAYRALPIATGRSVAPLVTAIVVTAVVFVGVKTNDTVNAAFDLGLGLMQWLAMAGPIHGSNPSPTSVIADPTDLVALPALGLSWWIGMRPEGGVESRSVVARRKHSSVAMLIVASLATLGTSPATTRSQVEHHQQVTLDRDTPAAVRHFSYRVDNRDPSVWSVDLTASAVTRQAGPGGEEVPAPGVLLSVIPDPAALGILDMGTGLFGESSLSMIEACTRTCEGGAWVVMRLADVAPETGLELRLDVGLHAAGGEGEGEPDIELALAHDPEQDFDGAPTTLVSRVEGEITVGADDPSARERLEIAIAGSALEGVLGYPLIGRILVGAETVDASHHPNAHHTDLMINSEYLAALGDGESDNLDLLHYCRRLEPCIVRGVIASEYDATMNTEADPANAGRGFVRLRWYLEARLEAFDGRDLPDDGLRVTHTAD